METPSVRRDVTDSELCGSCTMCCKLLGIPELGKPAGAWCRHCMVGRGCSIYMQRPDICRTYTCVWRQFREEGYSISDELRPDRCGVIVDADAHGRAHWVRVDPTKPDAWRRPAVQRFIAPFLKVGKVGLVCGDRLTWLRSTGSRISVP